MLLFVGSFIATTFINMKNKIKISQHNNDKARSELNVASFKRFKASYNSQSSQHTKNKIKIYIKNQFISLSFINSKFPFETFAGFFVLHFAPSCHALPCLPVLRTYYKYFVELNFLFFLNFSLLPTKGWKFCIMLPNAISVCYAIATPYKFIL